MEATSPAARPSADSGRERLLRAACEYFAANGIGDASLRQIAAGIGTSHRMLIYHFDSREGLLEAVVEELERGERDILDQVVSSEGGPNRERAWQFWVHVVDVVDLYGPLYFELAARAMRGDDTSAPLRVPNVEMWVEALTRLWENAIPHDQAAVHGRLNLAVSRGLLHDFLLTRDRRAVDEAMMMWDWLCFREPHPDESIARVERTWTAPIVPD